MFKIHGNLKEPLLLKIQSISDDRGLLIPFTDDIDHSLFRRCYRVENYGRGIIRGLHYHMKEIKIFTIVSGAGKFITLEIPSDLAIENDYNKISDFARQHPNNIKSFILSSRHHGVLFIPAGFANGWVSLEDHTILVALSNLRYEDAKNDDIRIDPFVIDKRNWEVIPR